MISGDSAVVANIAIRRSFPASGMKKDAAASATPNPMAPYPRAEPKSWDCDCCCTGSHGAVPKGRAEILGLRLLLHRLRLHVHHLLRSNALLRHRAEVGRRPREDRRLRREELHWRREERHERERSGARGEEDARHWRSISVLS